MTNNDSQFQPITHFTNNYQVIANNDPDNNFNLVPMALNFNGDILEILGNKVNIDLLLPTITLFCIKLFDACGENVLAEYNIIVKFIAEVPFGLDATKQEASTIKSKYLFKVISGMSITTL